MDKVSENSGATWVTFLSLNPISHLVATLKILCSVNPSFPLVTSLPPLIQDYNSLRQAYGFVGL